MAPTSILYDRIRHLCFEISDQFLIHVVWLQWQRHEDYPISTEKTWLVAADCPSCLWSCFFLSRCTEHNFGMPSCWGRPSSSPANGAILQSSKATAGSRMVGWLSCRHLRVLDCCVCFFSFPLGMTVTKLKRLGAVDGVRTAGAGPEPPAWHGMASHGIVYLGE